MLLIIRKIALPKQLGIGTFIFVSSVFIVLMMFINQLFSAKINDIVTSHQLKETELVANQLSEVYYTLESTLQDSSDFLNNQLKDLQIFEDKPVQMQSVDLPSLQLRYQKLNGHSTFMKNFAKTSKLGSSLVYKKGDQLYRIARSQADIPEILDKDAPAFAAIQKNEKFVGKVSLNGADYIALYSPLSNLPGFFSEMLVPYAQVLTPLKASVSKMLFGKDGYIFVSDSGAHKGELLIHPSNEGENLLTLNQNNPDILNAFNQMYENTEGVVTYTLSNQDTNSARVSKAIFQTVPGWNWVVTLESYQDEYQADIDSIVWLIAGIAAIASLVLTSILWFLIRQALKPLQDISRGLGQLGQGNLAFHFPAPRDKDSQNEIDILQNDTIRMRDNLVALVTKVQRSSQALLASTQSITDANVDLRNSATNSQHASIQVGSAVTQISTAIQDVSHSAHLVSKEALTVRESTEEGHKAVKSVENTVSQLSSAFGKASNTIGEVADSSKNIGSVVNVINEIAEQTNLLALNAAIEAARAGEQGRGFAVVADEVRVLAQRTQQSTEEIKKVVETLQKNSHSAVKEMEQGRGQVSESVELAIAAGQLLDRINQSIKAVEAGVHNVATTTEEQSVASNEIRQNAESLQAASTETLEQADQTQNHSNNIRAIAEDLQTDLSAFTLK
ncbi:MAG: methyl-accepting chemotaxis protein [Marinomonas sp.]